MWDTMSAVPELRATVPFNSGGSGGKLRPVTAIAVRFLVINSNSYMMWCDGLARMKQWWSNPQDRTRTLPVTSHVALSPDSLDVSRNS